VPRIRPRRLVFPVEILSIARASLSRLVPDRTVHPVFRSSNDRGIAAVFWSQSHFRDACFKDDKRIGRKNRRFGN
jgi:hypothetical protein